MSNPDEEPRRGFSLEKHAQGEQKFTIIRCPNCNGSVLVFENEIACRIFRHGILKDTGNQMDPHTPKAKCEELVNENKIWGCGKPFYFDGNKLSTCGYI